MKKEKSKIDKIWEKAKGSERLGMALGFLPTWLEDYKLSSKETAKLIEKSQNALIDDVIGK